MRLNELSALVCLERRTIGRFHTRDGYPSDADYSSQTNYPSQCEYGTITILDG